MQFDPEQHVLVLASKPVPAQISHLYVASQPSIIDRFGFVFGSSLTFASATVTVTVSPPLSVASFLTGSSSLSSPFPQKLIRRRPGNSFGTFFGGMIATLVDRTNYRLLGFYFC